MQTTIRLFKRGPAWLAKIDDPSVVKLFGTNIIPTGLTAKCNPAAALAKIRKCNPESTVCLIDNPTQEN